MHILTSTVLCTCSGLADPVPPTGVSVRKPIFWREEGHSLQSEAVPSACDATRLVFLCVDPCFH